MAIPLLQTLVCDFGQAAEPWLPPRCFALTSRIVLAPYPTPRHASALALCCRQFRGQCMVWNLSEVAYSAAIFGNQAIEHVRPGQPVPGLQDRWDGLVQRLFADRIKMSNAS